MYGSPRHEPLLDSRHAIEIIHRNAPPPRARAHVRDSARALDNGGFSTFGAFLQAVARASTPGGAVDKRLIRAPSGANETDPSAGGFAISTEYAADLLGSIYEAAQLMPLVDIRESDKVSDWVINGYDEVSRADGSRLGGTLSYWTGEAVQPTLSRPRFKRINLSAKRLNALTYVTNELLADAKMLDSTLRRAFQSEAAFKIDLGIVAGTGVGQLGCISTAPASIVVAKEIGQASGTITSQNLLNMWSRMSGPSRRNATWIVNESADAQIASLGSVGTAGVTNMYNYFPSGFHSDRRARLFGAPVVVAEQSPLLTAQGSVILADLDWYILVESGLDMAVSMESVWDTDESIFRFRWRGDGRPALTSPITPYNSDSTRSPFVVLGAG